MANRRARRAAKGGGVSVEALLEAGAVAYRGGQAEAARELFRRAVAADPTSAPARYNLGLALLQLGALDLAADAFSRAVALDPDLAQAQLALGNVRHRQGRLDEAVAALEAAIARRPDYAEAHMNLGNVRREQRRLGEAEAAGRRAIALSPAAPLAWRNLATTLQDQGELAGAIDAFDRTLALAPGFLEAESSRLYALNYDPRRTAAEVADEHRRWGERRRGAAPAPFPNSRDAERRLRVGYVSGDLHTHPIGYFLAGVLESHERSAFEVTCYSNGARMDATTRRLQGASDRWRQIGGLSDAAAEQQIRADGVDILVDLSGHAPLGRLTLFARHPAPVTATWLGYVGTTGLAAIDYLVTDPQTAPPGSDSLFAEALVRLPHGRFCYAPPAHAPAVIERPGGHPVVFGSFNHVLKLGPEVISLWSRVLAATPGSRLRLKWMSLADAGVRTRLVAAFAAEGVKPERLILSGFSPHAQMLAESGEVDIALDPFPYGGGLTTCEALWMGVPVITLPGERPASRQSLSFLATIGLPELAAASADDFVALAAALAADPARRAGLRASLRARMAASPLCRGDLFTLTLESAYRAMWRRWCAGEPPAGFDPLGGG